MKTVKSENYFIFKNNGTFMSFTGTHVTVNGGVNMNVIGTDYHKTGLCMLPIRKNLSPGTYEYENTINTPFSFTYFVTDNLAYFTQEGTLKVITNDTLSRKMELRFKLKLVDYTAFSDTIQVTDGHCVVHY